MDTGSLGLFSHVSEDTARALCMSAGDWSVLVASEVERILVKERKRRPEAFIEGLAELVRRGAITDDDAEVLRQLTKCIFAAIREKAEIETCRAEVLGHYAKLRDREASPAALAIASTAVRILDRHQTRMTAPGAHASAKEVSVGGAVGFGLGGALIGAGIGAAFGPIGAGIGGVIGGAVGAGVSVSNDLGV